MAAPDDSGIGVSRPPSARRPRYASATAGRRYGRGRALPGADARGRGAYLARAYRQGAQRRLRKFRQGSLLAVAATGFVLALWGVPSASDTKAQAPGEQPPAGQAPTGQAPTQQAPAEQQPSGPSMPGPSLPSPAGPEAQEPSAAPGAADTVQKSPEAAAREATGTVRDLIVGFYALLPKIGIAIAFLLLAAGITHFARPLIRRILGSWEKGEAAGALAGVFIWLLALGAAFSVIAGDARALVGLVGLFGLALSWALQTPIESFTGWLMNSFKAYYRIGDRIAVGNVFGDVYQIDFLTTTVWEVGGTEKQVQGEQATGALITFPNSEVLRSNIVNFTREFPFVWDEVTINVANESDLRYTAGIFAETARRVLGPAMTAPARRYQEMLEAAGLGHDIAVDPRVFVANREAWTDVTVRYLIPARERRRWSSQLVMEIASEMGRPEHRGRIVPGFPRTQVHVTRRPWWRGDDDAPAER